MDASERNTLPEQDHRHDHERVQPAQDVLGLFVGRRDRQRGTHPFRRCPWPTDFGDARRLAECQEKDGSCNVYIPNFRRCSPRSTARGWGVARNHRATGHGDGLDHGPRTGTTSVSTTDCFWHVVHHQRQLGRHRRRAASNHHVQRRQRPAQRAGCTVLRSFNEFRTRQARLRRGPRRHAARLDQRDRRQRRRQHAGRDQGDHVLHRRHHEHPARPATSSAASVSVMPRTGSSSRVHRTRCSRPTCSVPNSFSTTAH